MSDNESKQVTIKLDPISIEIIRKVDPIHRDSMINLGLALVSKTGYYNTITGNIGKELSDVTDLGMSVDNISNKVESKPVDKAPPKKTTSSWDDF